MESQAYRNPGTEPATREPRTIHLADVFEELDKLVAREGYNTVRECSLTELTGPSDSAPKPHCIAGSAYADWGVPLTVLRDLENVVGAEAWGVAWRKEDEPPFNFLTYRLQFTRAAAWALRLVQSEQDREVPWGTAVEHARGRAHVLYGTDYVETGTGAEIYVHGDRLSIATSAN